MSLISIPFTFSVGAVIVASQHNSNFSTIYSDYDGNIDNTNIASNAAIVDTKLAQITTAGKVSGAALVSLGSIPSGSGIIPVVNGGTGIATSSPIFSATVSGTQTIADGVTQKLLFATSNFDTNSNFSSSRFTPTISGYYRITARIGFNAINTGTYGILYIYKNGSAYSANSYNSGVGTGTLLGIEINDVINCNGSTDYIEIYFGNTGGTATITINNNVNQVAFVGGKIA